MVDLETQVRDYASTLPRSDAVTIAEVRRTGNGAAVRRHRGRGPHRRRMVAAASLVLVAAVLAAGTLVVRDEESSVVSSATPSPELPAALNALGSLPGQAFAMASSLHGMVAGGYGAWFSTDGVDWQPSTIDDLGVIADVVATASGFVAVGTGADAHAAVWTSPDGLAWTRVVDADLEPQTPPIPPDVSTPHGNLAAVADTGVGLVAVGAVFDGTFVGGTLLPDPWRPAIWRSADGTDWEPVEDAALGESTALTAVTTVGSTVVVTGSNGRDTGVWTSEDAARWQRQPDVQGSVSDLASFDGRLIAVGARYGNPGDPARATIWRHDGTEWTVTYQAEPAPVSDLTAVETTRGTLLAVGSSGPTDIDVDGLALVSDDGVEWTPLPSDGAPFAAGVAPLDVTVDGDAFVALAASGLGAVPSTRVFTTRAAPTEASLPLPSPFDAVRTLLWVDHTDVTYSAMVGHAVATQLDARGLHASSPRDCFQISALLLAPPQPPAADWQIDGYDNLESRRANGYLADQLRSASTPPGEQPPIPRAAGCPDHVAAALRELSDASAPLVAQFTEIVNQLEATDPRIVAAVVERNACYAARGYPLVRTGTDPAQYRDRLLTDGWVQEHIHEVTRELSLRLGADYADCMQPLVDARTAARTEARDRFVAERTTDIARLQAALDAVVATVGAA